MTIPLDDFAPMVAADLGPLMETYPGGTPTLPEGLERLAEEPLSNGAMTAVPWEYTGTAAVRLRGEGQPNREVTIRGVTIVEGEGENAVFRRYVDWAEVWAQLGRSSGRGESDDPTQQTANPIVFLDPTGTPIDGSPLGD
jgi:hypothetical protein